MVNAILMGNIKALRENNNWTQQEMAEKLSISTSSINKFEKGSQIPNIQYLNRYSSLFGCTIDELMNDIDLPEKLLKGNDRTSSNANEATVAAPVVTEKVIVKEVVVEQPKIINNEILYRGSVCFNAFNPKRVKSESIWKMSKSQKVWFGIWSLIIISILVSVTVADPELMAYGVEILIFSSILAFLVFTLPLYAIFVIFRFILIKKVPVYLPNGECEISSTGLFLIVGENKMKFAWNEVLSFGEPIESSDKTLYYVRLRLANSNEIVIAHPQLFEIIKPSKFFSIWKNSF